jgi:hypothetical protein
VADFLKLAFRSGWHLSVPVFPKILILLIKERGPDKPTQNTSSEHFL